MSGWSKEGKLSDVGWEEPFVLAQREKEGRERRPAVLEDGGSM